MIVLRQLGWFAVVGVTATATHTCAALVAHHYAGLAPLTANLVGYASAVMISYLGNARLTFGRPAADKAQFVRFIVISLLALGLNQLSVYYCTQVIGWPFAWALAIVAVIVPLFTFVMSKLWAFASPARPPVR